MVYKAVTKFTRCTSFQTFITHTDKISNKKLLSQKNKVCTTTYKMYCLTSCFGQLFRPTACRYIHQNLYI